MSPRLSVIVPVYNAEKYLHRCLDSITSQSYGNLEIICINDGSIDDSLSILREYESRDARIKVIDQKNSGVSAARNSGLDSARSQYIMFVDSDDFIEPNMMEVMVSTLEYHNADIVNCRLDDYYGEDDIRSRGLSHPPLVADTKNALLLLLNDSQVTSHVWRNLFKKELFDDIQFPVGKLYEDVIIMPYLFSKAKKIVFISDELYHYYYNEKGIARSKSFTNKKQLVIAFNQVFKFVKNNFPTLLDSYSVIYCKKMLSLHHEFMTIFITDDKSCDVAKHIENDLKRLCTKQLWKKHPKIFMRILFMPVTRFLLPKTRPIRLLKYRVFAALFSRNKKHYLEKIKKESM